MVLWSILLLMFYAVWTFGSIEPHLQEGLPWLASLIWLAMFIKRKTRYIHKDPVLYVGAAFLFYVAAQYINSGMILRHLPSIDRYYYSDPPFGLRFPWGFSPEETRRAFLLWFPAITVVLAIRHGITNKERDKFFVGLLINSLLIGAITVVSKVMGSERVLWLIKTPEPFCGPFGYANSAGSYSLLMLGISLDEKRWKIWIPLAINAMVIIVLSGCLAATILGGVIVILRIARLLDKSKWFYEDMNTFVICTVMLLVVVVINTAVVKPDNIMTHVKSRAWQWQAASKIGRQFPVYGTGYGGYARLLYFYVPVSYRHKVYESGRGNTHNDYLQFFVEYGAVGCLILLAMLILLYCRKTEKFSWSMIACYAVFIHGLVDLPFRCPLILITILAILSARKEQYEIHNTVDNYRNVNSSVVGG